LAALERLAYRELLALYAAAGLDWPPPNSIAKSAPTRVEKVSILEGMIRQAMRTTADRQGDA
jgi:hypothetical protein